MSFTLPSERALTLRSYVGETDRGPIELMCAQVFNGRDFVPSMLSTYEEDDHCLPYVVEDTASSEILAFINVRSMSYSSAKPSFYVEGIRIASSARKIGIGKAMLTSVLRLVSSEHGSCVFQSVTIPSNVAMEKVFHSTGWTPSPLMHLWPAASVLNTMRRDYYEGKIGSPMLQRLGISSDEAFPENVRKLCASWQPIYTAEEILSSIPQHGPRSHLVPFYFSVQEKEKAAEFLDARIAASEGREAYRLQSGGLMLVRRKAIDQFPRSYDFVISACVSSKEEAESCILFAETVLKFPWFFIAFGAPLSEEEIAASKILSVVDVASFRMFENKTTENVRE